MAVSQPGKASPRALLGRFLEGVEDPEARIVRGGRLAALGFFTGAVTSVPVNILLGFTGFSEYVFSVLVLGLSLLCLLIEWEEHRPSLLYGIGLLAITIITAVTVTGSPVYTFNYIFVALIVALVAPFHMLLGANALITLGLLTPAVIGDRPADETLALTLVCAPTLLVMSVLVYELTRMLERSRQDFWQLSRQDGLTGVGNYRSLTERLQEEIARHSRHGRQFAVVLLDLDNFKNINDEFGHLVGDRVLAEVARRIRESVRTEDAVFRQGGDEFAVIAPETGPAEIQPIVDRLRARVEAPGEDGICVKIGTGIASYPADGVTPNELLGMADIRLLDGKRDRHGNGFAASGIE